MQISERVWTWINWCISFCLFVYLFIFGKICSLPAGLSGSGSFVQRDDDDAGAGELAELPLAALLLSRAVRRRLFRSRKPPVSRLQERRPQRRLPLHVPHFLLPRTSLPLWLVRHPHHLFKYQPKSTPKSRWITLNHAESRKSPTSGLTSGFHSFFNMLK